MSSELVTKQCWDLLKSSGLGTSTMAQSSVTKQTSTSAAAKLAAKFATNQKTTAKASAGVSKTGTRGSNTPTATKQDNPIGTGKVTCSALNVRNGAGTNFARIGGLTKGKTVQVYEEKDGWLKIAYGTGFGWVSKQYTDYKSPEPVVTPEPEKPADPVVQPEPEQKFSSYQVKITADVGLRVRNVPGNGGTPASGSEILGLLSYGTVVTVLDEKNGWFKIDYNGKEGWICGDFVAKYTPSTDTGGGSNVTTDGAIPAGCSGVGYNIPIDPQNTNYNCGAASGAMSLHARGLDITEQQVASAAGTNSNDGTVVWKLQVALNSFAGSVYSYKNYKDLSNNDFFDRMKSSLSANACPIARISTKSYSQTFGYSSGGHYVCITGAYEASDGTKRLIVNDPYSGNWKSSNPQGQKLDMKCSDLHQCGKDKGDAWFILNA